MKVLFLDVDGVLNSYTLIHKVHTDKHAMDKELWREEHVDKLAVRRLNKILELTGASVVVSSTWRKIHSLHELRVILQRRGFKYPERVIDVTPELWRDDAGNRLYRGHEIQAWLDGFPKDVTSFVILDDDADMVHLMPMLVKTSMETGLLDEHVDAAVAILNRGEKASV